MYDKHLIEDYSVIHNTLRNKYIDYPSVVSLETFAYCNAACHFCPYHSLDRKGTKMPSALFQKIIHELEVIPEEYPFDINLSRVNEPFCDVRIFDFISYIQQRLPRCRVILFSNGSLVSKNLVAKLLLCQNIKIVHIS